MFNVSVVIKVSDLIRANLLILNKCSGKIINYLNYCFFINILGTKVEHCEVEHWRVCMRACMRAYVCMHACTYHLKHNKSDHSL